MTEFGVIKEVPPVGKMRYDFCFADGQPPMNLVKISDCFYRLLAGEQIYHYSVIGEGLVGLLSPVEESDIKALVIIAMMTTEERRMG